MMMMMMMMTMMMTMMMMMMVVVVVALIEEDLPKKKPFLDNRFARPAKMDREERRGRKSSKWQTNQQQGCKGLFG